MWIRDKRSDWRTELELGTNAPVIKKAKIRVPGSRNATQIDVYDPWVNKWTTVKSKNGLITLPDFKRSVVVKYSY
jgi:hypothetical protein